ncbi:response regulator [Larsenimonas rhizosphaerae]|uniref:Response regulator transcription factor n=1 Tax=Larsenimonas rhizosphaerae TaxID=2944682 RepID=A0AA41ZEW8_9GAMM|nr:response regulator transcription factor [Larsenimonas rhizosphaerae]MCM2130566.1 response regulator transcription factor [Larsenimonas rhizosphaerae]MCX2523270.1 response regulator transcription factor [Larsenimonas rhizosphaerae]
MRVLLVEDDPLLGDGVRTALVREGYMVDWLTDGRQADDALRCNEFSAVILDLGLPGMDGMEVLTRLRRRANLPVLILTARDHVDERVAGLDAGADDYVLKPFELDELLARLRVVIRRASGRARQVIELGALAIDEARHEVTWQQRPVSLSRREYALLRELANHPGQVLTRPQLENVLYGWQDDIESNALEVHIHHLRKKLAPELILTLRGIGYRLNDQLITA